MTSFRTIGADRRAFTLVELMIVIGIIAILMSLTFSVMYGLTTQAESEATAATIRKIDGVLQQRIDDDRVGLQQDGVSIWRRPDYGHRGKDGIAAGLVLHHHAVGQAFAEKGYETPRQGVGTTARSKGRDHAHGA